MIEVQLSGEKVAVDKPVSRVEYLALAASMVKVAQEDLEQAMRLLAEHGTRDSQSAVADAINCTKAAYGKVRAVHKGVIARPKE